MAATLIGGLPAIISVVLPKLLFDLGAVQTDATWIGSFSWFVGCGLGYAAFVLLERRNPMITRLGSHLERATDGVGK